jgi:hypothetical protein
MILAVAWQNWMLGLKHNEGSLSVGGTWLAVHGWWQISAAFLEIL